MEQNNTTADAKQEEVLSGICAYCLGPIDIHRDRKMRLYWVCPRCSIRVFGMERELTSLRQLGWIWREERPLEAFRAWLKRAMVTAGLQTKD